MTNYAMFNYEFLFGDHFSTLSREAKLFYIELMFHANNGFVANPKALMDSRSYDIGVLNELIKNGDILKLDDRCEIFITAFYIHNKGFKNTSWLATPYAPYWKGKLFIKKNGVATFTPQPIENTNDADSFCEKVKVPANQHDGQTWDQILSDIDPA